jgi:hypothetical protein
VLPSGLGWTIHEFARAMRCGDEEVEMQKPDELVQKRRRRIRLARTILRPLPRRAMLHRYPVLKWFAQAARKRPYLWTFRRSAMLPAFYAGSVLALLPVYGVQVPLAFGLALLLRANLATMVALQFITNPLTIIPVYLVTYRVGKYLVDALGLYEPASMIGQRPYTLALGGIVCGLILGFVLAMLHRFLAHEAKVHHWHLPHRPKGKDSASPTAAPVHKD